MDHAFRVIGRTQDAPNNPAAWNDEAVICDAWAEVRYAKAELDMRLGQAPVAAVAGANPELG